MATIAKIPKDPPGIVARNLQGEVMVGIWGRSP